MGFNEKVAELVTVTMTGRIEKESVVVNTLTHQIIGSKGVSGIHSYVVFDNEPYTVNADGSF